MRFSPFINMFGSGGKKNRRLAKPHLAECCKPSLLFYRLPWLRPIQLFGCTYRCRNPSPQHKGVIWWAAAHYTLRQCFTKQEMLPCLVLSPPFTFDLAAWLGPPGLCTHSYLHGSHLWNHRLRATDWNWEWWTRLLPLSLCRHSYSYKVSVMLFKGRMFQMEYCTVLYTA